MLKTNLLTSFFVMTVMVCNGAFGAPSVRQLGGGAVSASAAKKSDTQVSRATTSAVQKVVTSTPKTVTTTKKDTKTGTKTGTTAKASDSSSTRAAGSRVVGTPLSLGSNGAGGMTGSASSLLFSLNQQVQDIQDGLGTVATKEYADGIGTAAAQAIIDATTDMATNESVDQAIENALAGFGDDFMTESEVGSAIDTKIYDFNNVTLTSRLANAVDGLAQESYVDQQIYEHTLGLQTADDVNTAIQNATQKMVTFGSDGNFETVLSGSSKFNDYYDKYYLDENFVKEALLNNKIDTYVTNNNIANMNDISTAVSNSVNGLVFRVSGGKLQSSLGDGLWRDVADIDVFGGTPGADGCTRNIVADDVSKTITISGCDQPTQTISVAVDPGQYQTCKNNEIIDLTYDSVNKKLLVHRCNTTQADQIILPSEPTCAPNDVVGLRMNADNSKLIKTLCNGDEIAMSLPTPGQSCEDDQVTDVKVLNNKLQVTRCDGGVENITLPGAEICSDQENIRQLYQSGNSLIMKQCNGTYNTIPLGTNCPKTTVVKSGGCWKTRTELCTGGIEWGECITSDSDCSLLVSQTIRYDSYSGERLGPRVTFTNPCTGQTQQVDINDGTSTGGGTSCSLEVSQSVRYDNQGQRIGARVSFYNPCSGVTQNVDIDDGQDTNGNGCALSVSQTERINSQGQHIGRTLLFSNPCNGSSTTVDVDEPTCPATTVMYYNGCLRNATKDCNGNVSYGDCITVSSSCENSSDVQQITRSSDGSSMTVRDCGGNSTTIPLGCPVSRLVYDSDDSCWKNETKDCNGNTTTGSCITISSSCENDADIQQITRSADGSSMTVKNCGGNSTTIPLGCPVSQLVYDSDDSCWKNQTKDCNGNTTTGSCITISSSCENDADIQQITRSADGSSMTVKNCGGNSTTIPLGCPVSRLVYDSDDSCWKNETKDCNGNVSYGSCITVSSSCENETDIQQITRNAAGDSMRVTLCNNTYEDIPLGCPVTKLIYDNTDSCWKEQTKDCSGNTTTGSCISVNNFMCAPEQEYVVTRISNDGSTAYRRSCATGEETSVSLTATVNETQLGTAVSNKITELGICPSTKLIYDNTDNCWKEQTKDCSGNTTTGSCISVGNFMCAPTQTEYITRMSSDGSKYYTRNCDGTGSEQEHTFASAGTCETGDVTNVVVNDNGNGLTVTKCNIPGTTDISFSGLQSALSATNKLPSSSVSFTTAQTNVFDSGITSSKVTGYDGAVIKTDQMAALFTKDGDDKIVSLPMSSVANLTGTLNSYESIKEQLNNSGTDCMNESSTSCQFGIVSQFQQLLNALEQKGIIQVGTNGHVSKQN